MSVKKAIIPCAGFGTRFLPVTKVLPKELLPIVDTPALSYIVEEAATSGIEEILVIVSPQKKYIKNLFKANKPLNSLLLEKKDDKSFALANKKYDVKIKFAVQNVMNGNGMAVRLGKSFANGEPVAVLFGDDLMYTGDKTPVTKQLIDAYESVGGKSIVGCQCTSEAVARRCGVMITGSVVSDKITEISGIKEKPQDELPSNLVSLGRFVLSPSIFDAIDCAPLSENGEVYLTDAINLLAKTEGVCAYEFEGRRYDIGNKEGFLEATVEYALRDENLKDEFAEYLRTR
ncbi:MAG: UTP--glucose-1-phosphate uridylyltransferase [Bacteroides sp.]|nr:UTP--glucose-1-phosphate uridylyltransferase [Bacillota bacterium]MCM1393787.1 UTP--glucose-1-phosphate uridylyltransferase [[Eubacterium] siraeum]MCM1455519.1 UTP--glucose-1-phosphate uridylyltransferase [Bacteroides sp.]